MVIMFAVFTFSTFIGASVLFSWHIFVASTNQTTLEYFINKMRRRDAKRRGEVYVNKYDRGCRANLREMLCLREGGWQALVVPELLVRAYRKMRASL
mmetsp:Transcript_1649/g.2489  ORF Transcript_1649/g.2489 Transcript_1649/m.2489 type:complete len:97 (-) Transcript_1649:76-366(-)